VSEGVAGILVLVNRRLGVWGRLRLGHLLFRSPMYRVSAVASRELRADGCHHLVCEAEVDLVIFLALALTRNCTLSIWTPFGGTFPATERIELLGRQNPATFG